MTVQATINSTLNGQSADLILIEDGDTRSYEEKALSGGTETLIFTGLDGGEDKEYKAKIVPSTTDVTQTAEIQYGAEIEIDPIPHRDVDAANQIRETAEFNNGVRAQNLGLGDKPLINGLLTSALNDGEVLADDGYVYSTVQAAQDAASSWIFIGPGTFNESVTVDTAGLTIQGSGYDTLIDGGTIGTAIDIAASNVSVTSLSAQTTGGAGNSYPAVLSSGNNVSISDISVRDSDANAIETTSVNLTVTNSVVEGADNNGFITQHSTGTNANIIVSGCSFESGISGGGVSNSRSDDNVYANNIITGVGGSGLSNSNPSDNIFIGNRVHNVGGDGIKITEFSADNIVANNRISDSSGSDINTNSNSTTLDGNNTGASN